MTEFELPKELPKTFEEVRVLIDQFTDFNQVAACSFAHIVLDDYNLEDSYIEWCLKREQVDKWREFRLKGIDKSTPLVEANERMELEKDVIQIIRFLQYLLMIPEETRTWYVDDEETNDVC